MKRFLPLVCLCLSFGAHAVTQSELDEMMANTRAIVENVGTADDVNAFDAQMEETKRLGAESAATRQDTARIRADSQTQQEAAARANAIAKDENRSVAYQQKQDDLRRYASPDAHPLPSRKTPKPCADEKHCVVDR